MRSQSQPGKPNRQRAEEQFKTTKKIDHEFETTARARRAEAEKTGRLRALRLAKEEADKDTANRETAGKVRADCIAPPNSGHSGAESVRAQLSGPAEYEFVHGQTTAWDSAYRRRAWASTLIARCSAGI